MRRSGTQKRHRASRIKRACLLVLLACLTYFSLFIAIIHQRGTLDSAQKSDLIIVLGAGLRSDGRPGPALTRRSQLGAELWRNGLAPMILCAGGQAESYPRSEAAACREVLLMSGVASEAILLEAHSRSTEENAIFSKPIMADHGFEDAILVSDSYHILRATWLFEREGVQVSASPVPYQRIRGRLAYPLSLLREFLAFHWHFFKDALGLPVTHISGL